MLILFTVKTVVYREIADQAVRRRFDDAWLLPQR